MATAEQHMIGATQVRARYSISEPTLDRWLVRPEMNFPKPLKLGRKRFWLLAELEAWERAAAAGRSPATGNDASAAV